MKTALLRTPHGFTLLEVIVVTVLIGIAAAIAIPSVLSFLPGYRLSAATRNVVSDLNQARSEAIKKNKTCTISFNMNLNGTQYDYVAWCDENGDSSFDNGEEFIATSFRSYPGVSFDSSQGGGDGLLFTGTWFSFNSRGLCKFQDPPPAPLGRIYLINDKGAKKNVMISLAGAVMIDN